MRTPSLGAQDERVEHGPTTTRPVQAEHVGRWPGRQTVLAVLGLLAALVLPLVVALVALARPRWFPVLDMAMTELRLRDVASTDPPLIGLSGRIGDLGEQGSHPGPLSFYALWPVWRLLGASPWAMQVAAVSLHLVALAASLAIAVRRGGLRLALGLAVVLALLVRLYGTPTLTEPWNPYLPVLWWVVFLLALWSVVGGDLPMLPVAVFAGSFGMQTHIPYLGNGAVLLVVAGVATLAWAVGRGAPNGPHRGRAARWGAIAVGLGVVLWLPPLIDQLTAEQGNATKLLDYFGDPPSETVGLVRGVELMLAHLDPIRLVRGDLLGNDAGASVVPGLALLAAWAGATAVARRRRFRPQLRLLLVLGAAMAVGALSLGRIFDFVWFYLGLWAYGITALVLLAVGWTVAAEVSTRLDPTARRRWASGAAPAALGVVVVAAGLFTVDAADAEPPDTQDSGVLAEVVPATVAALEDEVVPGSGRNGRYLVSWEIDPVGLGAQGFGLFLELERQGFDVGALDLHQAGARPHRVRTSEEATASVHLAVGEEDVERWRAKPGVREVAFVDPRTDAERAEYQRLSTELFEGLEAAQVDEDLLAQARRIPFIVARDERVPEDLRDNILRMVEIGLPTGVFVGGPFAIGFGSAVPPPPNGGTAPQAPSPGG